MKRKLLPRIFITLLGAALILWAAGKIALGIIGEPETATRRCQGNGSRPLKSDLLSRLGGYPLPIRSVNLYPTE